jgi:soluble lytic murein transglycosylase-like protein
MLTDSDFNRVARETGVPENILRALTQVESSGEVKATRFEKDYHYLWDIRAHGPFKGDLSVFPGGNPELTGQKTSWGPIQVMGAVARSYGFTGQFEELLGVEGLRYGAKLYNTLYSRYYNKFGIDGVIASYNAGSPRYAEGRFVNQGYVDKVRKAMEGV